MPSHFRQHVVREIPIAGEPRQFYRWPQELLENAHLSFETDRKSKAIEATKDRRIAAAAGSQNQPSLERLGYHR
jgi:hypothetical protein